MSALPLFVLTNKHTRHIRYMSAPPLFVLTHEHTGHIRYMSAPPLFFRIVVPFSSEGREVDENSGILELEGQRVDKNIGTL